MRRLRQVDMGSHNRNIRVHHRRRREVNRHIPAHSHPMASSRRHMGSLSMVNRLSSNNRATDMSVITTCFLFSIFDLCKEVHADICIVGWSTSSAAAARRVRRASAGSIRQPATSTAVRRPTAANRWLSKGARESRPGEGSSSLLWPRDSRWAASAADSHAGWSASGSSMCRLENPARNWQRHCAPCTLRCGHLYR